ncbi:MAG TPA: serine protease [Frankiaceae bacterium]|nr:serine protease [Frankiaceae bacterium]
MTQRIRTSVAAAALLAGSAVLGTTSPASAVPAWAPFATATVKPGVQTLTNGGQCTANFVFYDNNNDVYIGQSAHCASTGGPTDTNGCITGSQPLGTNVTVRGATYPGKLAYSSWRAMQSASTPPTADQCAYNDFALVKLDTRDYGKVNPSIPKWGGPVALNTTGAGWLSSVYTYGNSSLRFGISQLSPKTGVMRLGATGSVWSYRVYTVTPGIPGDSGSAFLDSAGNALGTLSTVSADGSNGVANLNLALNYMRANSSFTTVQLAMGTQAFNPSLV